MCCLPIVLIALPQLPGGLSSRVLCPRSRYFLFGATRQRFTLALRSWIATQVVHSQYMAGRPRTRFECRFDGKPGQLLRRTAPTSQEHALEPCGAQLTLGPSTGPENRSDPRIDARVKFSLRAAISKV